MTAALLNWADSSSEEVGENLNEKSSLQQHHPFSWRVTGTAKVCCLHPPIYSVKLSCPDMPFVQKKESWGKLQDFIQVWSTDLPLGKTTAWKVFKHETLLGECGSKGNCYLLQGILASSNLSWERGSWDLVPISGLVCCGFGLWLFSFLRWNFRSRSRTIKTNHTCNLQRSPRYASFFHAGIPNHSVEDIMHLKATERVLSTKGEKSDLWIPAYII